MGAQPPENLAKGRTFSPADFKGLKQLGGGSEREGEELVHPTPPSSHEHTFCCTLCPRESQIRMLHITWVPLPEGISNWAGAPANSDPELSRKLRNGGGRGSVPAFSLSGRSALFPVLSLARSPGVVPPKLNSPEPFCRQSPQGFPPASPQGLPLRGYARPQDPAARVA